MEGARACKRTNGPDGQRTEKRTADGRTAAGRTADGREERAGWTDRRRTDGTDGNA